MTRDLVLPVPPLPIPAGSVRVERRCEQVGGKDADQAVGIAHGATHAAGAAAAAELGEPGGGLGVRNTRIMGRGPKTDDEERRL